MKIWPKLLLLAPALLVLANLAQALEWKAQHQSVTTAPFQLTSDIVFEFRNNTPRPVAIVSLQTNCDCLAAQADQSTYAPGATGTIKARFTIGDRSGPYERSITVVTNEAGSPVKLHVHIEVPEIYTLTPRSVSWTRQAQIQEQVVELRPAPGLEISFTEARPTNEAFQARLETVKPGRLYRLHLVPRSTAEPASAAIRIFGREKSGHDVVVSAYADVQ
ncbi:MAG: DUF1573 domain-containing protein [Opitutae bacterium]